MSLFHTRQLSSLFRYTNLCAKSFPQWRATKIPVTIISKPISPYSTAAPELSKKEKLKQAFKDYGATVFLFHMGMSLCSLGVWYLIVSSGVDVPELLRKVNIDESKLQLASGASTFVVAYALHKMTAPIRISITLGSAPFIVSYLRRIGVLKVKKAVGGIQPEKVNTSTPKK
ncbi:hypothetical protein M8J76_012298 [Diaphorina citri]|nr:hypothetical protein M8J76_012298 [Diaphorina citri]KAI5743685.1 hypothetical protein M8J77_021079 [Diaphorina citri]